jgi:murein DD-endopeptidase MepM/ murein hydrolase activator NlpD
VRGLAVGGVLLLATGATAQTTREANELLRKGQTAQRENRWDEAVRAFGTLSALYPDNPDVAAALGYNLYKRGELDRAEKQYLAALALDEKHPAALFGLGQISIARKQWSEAAERFRETIRLAPSFEPLRARHNLALALFAASRYADAVTIYREALSLPAQTPYPELYRGALDSALAAEDYALAATWAEAATQRYPKDAWLWNTLAGAYSLTQRPTQANAAFERAETLAYASTEPLNRTVLSLPFRGAWRVILGNNAAPTHRGLSGRFAWDFMAVDEWGGTRAEDAPRGLNEGYLSFGQEILAPADGRVVALQDGTPDNEAQHRPNSPYGGNYIVIEHAPGEFSLLGHLQNGSVEVKIGQTVQRGQRVARCGNSGNTSQPHLHFSFMGLYGGVRISQPAAFSSYSVLRDGQPVSIDRGVPALNEIVSAAPPKD